jgi:diguanylate cyclase (GGDEF)-like protein
MTAPDAYPELSYLPLGQPPARPDQPSADRPGERHAERRGSRPVLPSVIPADWVVRAQDGEASKVLIEIEIAVRNGLEPRDLTRALYVRALCLAVLGEGTTAVGVARELSALCRDLGLQAAGLQARALLVDLLRRDGQLEQAMEQLAHAVALEPALRDLTDPDVQVALGALAVALRLSGAAAESNRVDQRLAAVEELLPLHQRVSRWSNLAFEHAAQAMAVARRPPFEVDAGLVDRAVREIENARTLANWGTYHVVVIEAQVLAALPAALVDDAATGVAQLHDCQQVLERGPEATSAQLFWAVGMVRALARLERFHEAAQIGTRVLALVRDHGKEGDRAILAYEVMRAEHPRIERPGSGTAEYLSLTEDRVGTDLALVSALFRARVDLLRGADERRVLARAASLDALTGLVNRRGAAAAIADFAALPEGETVALLLIDLDGFKDVNDNFGHLAGDVALRRVSDALRTAARLEDVVARWGGDEFVVVAVLDEDRAMALADRLRDTIRRCAHDASLSPVTGSVGVVVRDAPLDEETWLRRADEAMYVAKRSGGDATVLG